MTSTTKPAPAKADSAKPATGKTVAVALVGAHGVVIPDKKYFKIGEIAELVGVEPHVLRYWETQFPQIRPHKARSGHRLYRRRDLENLLVIRELLHVRRFTIAGARQALREGNQLPLMSHVEGAAPEPNAAGARVLHGEAVAAADYADDDGDDRAFAADDVDDGEDRAFVPPEAPVPPHVVTATTSAQLTQSSAAALRAALQDATSILALLDAEDARPRMLERQMLDRQPARPA